eukprot:scaffold161_cov206-Chaetoceros_neogracile.AAC.12
MHRIRITQGRLLPRRPCLSLIRFASVSIVFVLVFIISNVFMLSSPEALDFEPLIPIQVKADIVQEDVFSPIVMMDTSQYQQQHPTHEHLDQTGGLKDITEVAESNTDASTEEIKARTPGAVIDAEKDQLTLDAHSTNRLANAKSVQNGSSTSNHEESPEGEDTEESAYLSIYGEHRVKSALASLPIWLQDYFAWHRNQRKPSHESEVKYLAISCVVDDRCGGFSDRLRTLPFYLFLASRLGRVLCIYWSRPFGLDSFLQPLPSGIDWRCPTEFKQLVDTGKNSRNQAKYRHYSVALSGVQAAEEAITFLLNSNDQFYSIGFRNQNFVKVDESNVVFHAHSYNQTMPTVNAWMHIPLTEHIFRAMFEPIAPIARRINTTMTRLGLVENEYTSVHVRARYPVDSLIHIIGDRGEALKHDKNSIDLTRHFVGKPVTLGKEQIEYQAIGIESRNEILHLENEHKNDHVEFYPLIEDLLIMGGSQCVVHGVGSFGAFAAGLAGNQCRAIHRKPSSGAPDPCPNSRGDNFVVNITDKDLVFGEK